jgi:S-adenosylhomocysteine hydrolase
MKSYFLVLERGGRRRIGIAGKPEARSDVKIEICLPMEHEAAVLLETNVSARLKDYAGDDGSYSCSLTTIQQVVAAAHAQESAVEAAIWREEDAERARKFLGPGATCDLDKWLRS